MKLSPEQAIALGIVHNMKDAGLYPPDLYERALTNARQFIRHAQTNEFRRGILNRGYLARYGMKI